MSVKIRNIEVGNLIGESSKFRVYLGQISESQKTIIKIAKTFEDNAVLTMDAKEFSVLKNFGALLRKIAKYPCADAVNYHLLFANLLSSFIEESQKDRRINVFTIPEIDIDKLTPLAKLSSQVEMDARSSVWIIGRLFKFYGMFEIMRVENGDDACKYPVFSAGDYLVSPADHRLVYYNYSGEIYDVYATDIVKSIAKYILKWTCFSNAEEEIRYRELLEDLASSGRGTAAEAHRDLYDLVREIWGISYYPFTYRQRDTLVWKNIKED